MVDLSLAAHSNPSWLGADVMAAVIAVRERHPSWGPRKVRAWLERQEPGRRWPAASKIGSLYGRVGLTHARRMSRRAAPQSAPPAATKTAKEAWCIDFKGWFLTGDDTHVEPLTLSDAYSRYLLCCLSLRRNETEEVWPMLERAFKDQRPPRKLRSDNSLPFAGPAVGGLSRLAILAIKANVRPERIAPGALARVPGPGDAAQSLAALAAQLGRSHTLAGLRRQHPGSPRAPQRHHQVAEPAPLHQRDTVGQAGRPQPGR